MKKIFWLAYMAAFLFNVSVCHSGKDDAYWVAYAAQEMIGRTLKAPSTAKWPGLDTFDVQPVKGKKNLWAVKGYVDAQNGFGAMIRTHFNAKIRKDSDGGMTLVSLKKRP